MLATEQPETFQKKLAAWFNKRGKDYPWRNTTDPWAILISEVMLQQTQVATVLNKGYFSSFLNKFPNPVALAGASEQEILSAWEGLGYYRRVRNLQKTAIAICEQHGGSFPRAHSDILALPGVGPYTAGAVSSFAYNEPQAIVDANVARIFARLFDYQERIDTSAGNKQLWHWAETLLDTAHPRRHNTALMQLGQQVCTNQSPHCLLCPICDFCQSPEPTRLPLKKSKKATVHLTEHCALHIHPDKGIALRQQLASEHHAGMWKLPQRGEQHTAHLTPIYSANYAVTHHKITLTIYDCLPFTLRTDETYHSLDQLPTLPLAAAHRKALDSLLG